MLDTVQNQAPNAAVALSSAARDPAPPVDKRDQFIPIRKTDIVAKLIEQGAWKDDNEREKFRQFCQLIGCTYHYKFFARLETLRDTYYYFNPELKLDREAHSDESTRERAYGELLAAFRKVLQAGNFVEVPHEEIARAHAERTALRVKVKAETGDFRDVHVFRRGHHRETHELRDWFGLRKRSVDVDVYDDVILFLAAKSARELGSKRKIQQLSRRKLRPGAVLIKYFRNIARNDLQALFPNVRVVMSAFDRVLLGVPALAGSVPILLNLASTVTVLFAVIAFYLGISATIEEDHMKRALAAVSGLVALGAFVARQWMKYQRQSLKYQQELTDNIYFRNINNNAGIFDYLIGAAEEQECKEAVLAYYFLLTAPEPLTQDALDTRIEVWLKDNFAIDIDFEVDDALGKLERLSLLKRDGDKLGVPPLDPALVALDRAWDNFFQFANAQPAPAAS